MKVLLVSDASSIWTARYIDQVLLRYGIEVVILTSFPPSGDHIQTYHDPKVEVVEQAPVFGLFSKIPFVRGVSRRVRTARMVRSYGPFDFVHVHLLLVSSVKLAFRCAHPRVPVLLSYWGSDLLRANAMRLHRLRGPLRRSAIVTVSSAAMLDAFRSVYSDLKIEPREIPFGLDLLPVIDSLRLDNGGAVADGLTIPVSGKTVVTVGYNGRSEQQHLMVLTALSGLDRESLRNIHVVVPMTYGTTESYVREVEGALSGLPCSSQVLRTHLGPSEQAKLCLATDLFIHAQTTDALSASLQEFLYAGATVLNAAWLSYPELAEDGVVMYSFSSWEELTDRVYDYLGRGELGPDAEMLNRTAISKRSWEHMAPLWSALYLSAGVSGEYDSPL